MGIAVLVVGALVLFFVGVLVWNGHQSSGRAVAVTELEAGDAVDEAIKFFVPGGWQVEQEVDDSVFMRRGPSGCTSLLFLVIFFPLGLVYLFTDWGKGSVSVSAQDYQDGTRVEIEWHNAGIRSGVDRLMNWLEEQEEEDDDEQSDSSLKRRYRRRRQ